MLRHLAPAGAGLLCGLVALGSTGASAQQLARLSCGQLWYERNAIYAEYGHCFRTPQAIAVFGPRCYPPYGQLPRRAQQRVGQILAWERRKGCNE
jgi:hypothetical protein